MHTFNIEYSLLQFFVYSSKCIFLTSLYVHLSFVVVITCIKYIIYMYTYCINEINEILLSVDVKLC